MRSDNSIVILYIEDVDLNGRMEATLRGVSVILYIEDVDLNPAPHLRFPDNPVILYIEDVDLNTSSPVARYLANASSSTLRMWI